MKNNNKQLCNSQSNSQGIMHNINIPKQTSASSVLDKARKGYSYRGKITLFAEVMDAYNILCSREYLKSFSLTFWQD
jgi:hypothetical protein